jgi:hypothetical protein
VQPRGGGGGGLAFNRVPALTGYLRCCAAPSSVVEWCSQAARYPSACACRIALPRNTTGFVTAIPQTKASPPYFFFIRAVFSCAKRLPSGAD